MDDEIDLRQYLKILWRRRHTVVAVTVASVLAAGLFSFLSPPIFEAKAMVLVAKPSFQAGAPPDPINPGLKIGAVLVPEFPTETLVAFAKSSVIIHKVTEQAFKGTVQGSNLAKNLTVTAVRNTNLIEFKVQGSDPAGAARVANQWATVVTAESELLFSTGAKQSYSFFDTRLGETKLRLEAAEETVRNFNASSKIGVLQARLNAVTGQIAAYQSRLTDVSVALQRLETELVRTEAQIQHQPRILTLSKSITTDPFLHQAASEAAKQGFVELSRLQLKNEELNPVYLNLDQARANLDIQAAGLRTESAKITQAIVRLNGELNDLRSQLAGQQSLQTQLARSVDSAKQVYDVLQQRREEAQIASASQAGSVKVVAQAIVPDLPVAPRKMLNVTLAGVLGLIAGTMLAFMMEFFNIPAPVPVSLQTTLNLATQRRRGIEAQSLQPK